jgi:hypothetical protein
MAASNTDLLRKKKSNFSTTLNGAIDDSVQTIALNSTSGLPTDTAITLTIDRIDANGTSTPTKKERVTGVISGSNLTVALRAQDGTTAQSHSSGAVVEDIWDADTWNDVVGVLMNTYDQVTGLHNPTVIYDSSANEVIKLGTTASAVNEVTITNAATSGTPTISATGNDTNIDLTLLGKGTGKVKANSSYGTITANSDGATITFNMATSNLHSVTLGGNRTLAVSNVSTGQCFILRLLQDGTGSRTVNWFTTIKWAGGSAPTLTTTASKADVIGFLCTGTNTYDGFIIGLNL